ncbi:rod shape-determining protein MreC [Candidatus Microgenomates bacterium]|nr:rod shape-determining protein MreC [Candidatus Microgenomates bacterium]
MRRFISFLILSFLLLGLDFFGWTRPIRAVVEKGSEPMKLLLHRQITNYKLQITNLRFSRKELIELKKKTEELEREKAKLEIENVQLKIDNADMYRLLQVPLPADWKFLPAKILGQTRYLLINQGRRDGVKKGMSAVFENVLVGIVIDVSEKSAKIMLPLDADSKIAVKIGRVKGVLIGENDRLVLTEVLQGKEIKAGDLIITSGENEIFPANLLIGKIKSVEKEERDPYQKAEVEPLVEYDKLETVFLILD